MNWFWTWIMLSLMCSYISAVHDYLRDSTCIDFHSCLKFECFSGEFPGISAFSITPLDTQYVIKKYGMQIKNDKCLVGQMLSLRMFHQTDLRVWYTGTHQGTKSQSLLSGIYKLKTCPLCKDEPLWTAGLSIVYTNVSVISQCTV